MFYTVLTVLLISIISHAEVKGANIISPRLRSMSLKQGPSFFMGQAKYGFPESNSFVDIDKHIIGGVDAPERFAYMVALIFLENIVVTDDLTDLSNAVVFQVCGGSIVSSRHVLTAAHCIEVFLTWLGELWPTFRGVIGTNKYDSTDQLLEFSSYVIHPEYDYWTIKNDIGVVTTKKTIKMNERVQIIALDFNWIGGGEDSHVTGWGLTNHWPSTSKLQYLNVNTISSKECVKAVEGATETWLFAPSVDPKTEVCTLHSPGHGMCNGDSGSPLVSKESQKQIGIVSWGFPCANGLPDMFVRVSAFKDFILSIIKP